MNKLTTAVIALLGVSKAGSSSDDTFDNTLAGCESFASKFENTCASTSSTTSLSSVASSSVTCSNVGQCPSSGSGSSSSCTFSRKLCVTCSESGGTVTIRVQSNGLPSHCYQSPQTAPADLDVDFEATWMPSKVDNSDA